MRTSSALRRLLRKFGGVGRGGEAGVSGVFVRVLAWAVEKKISGVLDGLLKADHNLASLLLRSGGSLKN
jgi:hypothetical protein